jgi:hypothetical protein
MGEQVLNDFIGSYLARIHQWSVPCQLAFDIDIDLVYLYEFTDHRHPRVLARNMQRVVNAVNHRVGEVRL